jgi:hypothetical protein
MRTVERLVYNLAVLMVVVKVWMMGTNLEANLVSLLAASTVSL